MARTYTGLDVESDFGGRFPWKSRLVDVGGGVRQAVVDEGPRDAPLTFVLLHGNPTWGFLYRRFIERLAPRFRVVVPDHVGFGRSDKPRDPAYYTLERHVANLEATLRALKVERAVPVVQDWGGPIGLGWATRHPDRVAGLVVLNTWSFVSEAGGVRLPWLFRFLVLGKGGWRRSTRRNLFTELFVIKGGARKLDPAERDAYRAPHPTPEDRVGVARFPQLVPPVGDTAHESYAAMRAIEEALPKVHAKPALVVWALKDPAFRKPQLERWKAELRNLDGPHLLPAARHYLQEDAPDEILSKIDDWLARMWPSPAPAKGRAARAAPRKAVPAR